MNTLFRHAASFAFVTLLFPALADASPEFVGELQEQLQMQCTPRCSVCHTSNPGSAGTATQPFAVTMKNAGLAPGDIDTVGPALESLKGPDKDEPSDDIDSDGDGVSDLSELTTGVEADPNDPDSVALAARDPSVPGAGEACELVDYGCGAHVARQPTAPAGVWMTVGAAVVILTLALRRRSRS